MRLPETCIRRPVFASVLSLVLLLVGLIAYGRLTVREYPRIDEPVISVATTYPGASASIIETQVTQILEGSIAGIEGIDILESTSRSENSRITVRFNLEVDPDVAASDVRDRVSRVRGRLPDEIDEPVIAKVEADAQAVVYLTFAATGYSALELTDYVDRYVVDRLKNLTGVADVQIYGERRYAMRIWIDRERLAAYDLTVQDIEAALRAQNVEVPSGRIESQNREFSVLSRTGLQSVEQFERIVLKSVGGFPVMLRDVAKVELGAANVRREARYNGAPTVTVGIIKQAVANPLDVSSALREELPAINASLPDGMSAEIGTDSAVFIDRSIEAVYTTIAEAVILVVLVILFFLRSLRASLIPVVTIPISLIATCTLMFALGFSINTLTLLAMVLAIGLVVDDAIVVLENIHRHIERGEKPFVASIIGIREIAFAVVAMSLTLAAVYAPVAFTPGRTGRLFIEFALTLACAVLVSGFVALTLTPMMCSKLLKHQSSHGLVFRLLERGFNAVENGYKRAVTLSLRARPLVVLLALAVAGAAAWFYPQLPQELSPVEDRGEVMIIGSAPEGSTLAYSNDQARRIEALVEPIDAKRATLLIIGWPEVTDVRAFLRLKDWSERTVSQQSVVAELIPQLRRIPGLSISAVNPPSLGQSRGSRPVEFVIQTSGTYEELQGYVAAVMERVKDYPGLVNLDSDLKLNKPELRVELDRARVSDLGLDVALIGRTLETLLGSRQVTRFEWNGEQYDVLLQLADADRTSPEVLDTIFLRGPDGQMIQLSNVVRIAEGVAPKDLRRFNQLRAATLSATLAPGTSLGEALAVLQQAAEEVLPDGVLTDFKGQSREFRSSSDSLVLIFGLALCFIFLVLAAQFESYVDPIIILLTVPFSITGALAALWLTGGTLNVYSQIGLVTLIGLITKHGILIVEFSNQKRVQGLDRRKAVIEAAAQRLRPILMTTGAMVLGALPLALAEGAGAESRRQIGWVIVGGMSVGTLMTLFVLPSIYTLLTRRRVATAVGYVPRPEEAPTGGQDPLPSPSHRQPAE